MIKWKYSHQLLQLECSELISKLTEWTKLFAGALWYEYYGWYGFLWIIMHFPAHFVNLNYRNIIPYTGCEFSYSSVMKRTIPSQPSRICLILHLVYQNM